MPYVAGFRADVSRRYSARPATSTISGTPAKATKPITSNTVSLGREIDQPVLVPAVLRDPEPGVRTLRGNRAPVRGGAGGLQGSQFPLVASHVALDDHPVVHPTHEDVGRKSDGKGQREPEQDRVEATREHIRRLGHEVTVPPAPKRAGSREGHARIQVIFLEKNPLPAVKTNPSFESRITAGTNSPFFTA